MLQAIRTISQFLTWEIRHLDGRRLASTSMRPTDGLGTWVREMICAEHDCRPEDVTFADDDLGEDWIMVEKITGWDKAKRDFATKIVRVGYYQMSGLPIRGAPSLEQAVEMMQAAE